MSNQIVHSLEGQYYTDPSIFEIEKNGLLLNTWQFAGHVSALPKVGSFFCFEIAGESLFCVRDKEDSIKCFYNVCQHRGHRLIKGEGRASVITCPYHAWSYALDGSFIKGTNVESVPGIDTSSIKLTPVNLEIMHGFIFVNLSSDAKPMDEWFPQVRKQLKDHVPQIDSLKPLEWIEIPEKCNWKVSIENYSECYHCPLTHQTFSTGIIKPETYDIQPQGYCLRHTTECQNLDSMTYPIDLDSNDFAGKYSSWFLWPMFSFQVYPGNVLNTYHWRPVDAHNVVVWRGWYTIDGAEDEVIRKLALQDRTTTVEEDIALVESVHQGLGSRGYNPGPLVLDPACGVNSEHSIKVLQQWMREAVQSQMQNQ